MKSYIEKFKELTYEELLDVNGGYGTKTSTSSTTRRRARTTTTKTYDPLTSGLENLSTKSKSNIPAGYDPKIGWLPGYGPNSNAYQVSTSGDKTKETNTVNQESSVTTFSSHENLIKSTETETASGDTVKCEESQQQVKENIVSNIEKAIKDIGKKVEGAYVVGQYQCDDYVSEILTKAGYNPSDYYIDKPHEKTVDTHINEYLSDYVNAKYGYINHYGCEAGAYVVFMSDRENEKASHAALMIVNDDGTAYIADNSSHNNVIKNEDGSFLLDSNKNKQYYGGIEITTDKSVKNLCSQYTGYEDFYFQKIQ